jgi:type II secretory pathway component PulJ
MLSRNSGFSLISIMVYLALFTLLVGFLVRTSAALYPHLIAYGQQTTDYLKLCAAIDRVVHDLYQVPTDTSQWNMSTDNELSWKLNNKKTVTWRLRKNKLIRTEGIYDQHKKGWHTKTKSIAADSIMNCAFKQNWSGSRLKSITVTLTSDRGDGNQISFERTVAVRCGVPV